jgi:hypothetical protein
MLNLGARWRWVVKLHAPAALTPGKELRYALNRRLGGPTGWNRRKSLVPDETGILDHIYNECIVVATVYLS